MKKRKVNKNFDLNKQTVANLTSFEQQGIQAGNADISCPPPECGASNSAVLLYSTNYYNTQFEPMPADTRLWPCLMDPINND